MGKYIHDLNNLTTPIASTDIILVEREDMGYKTTIDSIFSEKLEPYAKTTDVEQMIQDAITATLNTEI